jgi:hypothetical protein
MDKDTFLTQTFTAPKHQPPTNLGYFDATYTPATGRLCINIRFELLFVNAADVQWNADLQNTFKTEFTNRIPEYWNNKFVIRCTKPGWTDIVARPDFTLQEGADRHFSIKAAGTIGTRNTAVRPYGTGHDRRPDTIDHATAIFGAQAADRWANAAFQLGRIKDHLRMPFTVPVGTATGGGQFSFFAMSLLQSYANNVTHAFKKRPKPKIRLTTVGEASTKPADRVKAILQGFGVKNHMKTKKGAGGGPATGVEVRWDDEQEFNNAFPQDTQSVPLFSQATVVHEYGHMLGLPDEYNVLCSESENPLVTYCLLRGGEMATHLANNPPSEAADTAAIKETQKVFMELCTIAGLVPPPFGRANMNIMSGGSRYEPHHCLTVWNCLCGLTDGIIGADEWEIRMA